MQFNSCNRGLRQSDFERARHRRYFAMMRRTFAAFTFFFLSALSGHGADGQEPNGPRPEPPPRSPADSMAMISLRSGFSLELVAAEPLVADPVAIEFGADGRLWITEMADYPYGMDGKGQPGGRVRFLEDTDHDGVFDRSVIFLDGLSFPTAAMPWRDGVLVTAAPVLLFARDTDGDGRADERTELFRGFMEGNQQLRVNGLCYGLDNWVYCANGGHHAGFGADNSIVALRTDNSLPLGSRDFRFNPDTSELEPLSGPSQFGRVRDNWNHWFGVQNSYPLWHYVLEDAALRRNMRGHYPDTRQQLRLPANPEVFATSRAEKRYHSFQHAGHYTSACGPCIYRDELLFESDERIHAFTCEPFHNLVQHHTLHDEGVSFRGERAATSESFDFFASADYWTRPVMARTGPDGALWIVDMYRYMIEHPDWLPPEGRAELEPFYRQGEGRGRIYRVYPQQAKPPRLPRLAELTNRELVDSLSSPHGLVRDMAQRLLIERQAYEMILPLQQLLEHNSPTARLHAAYTLSAFDAARQHDLGINGASKTPPFAAPPCLSSTHCERLFHDPHPELRRHALRLVNPTTTNGAEVLARGLTLLANDPSAKVRLQVATRCGDTSDVRSGRALRLLAQRLDLDSFSIAALISSLPIHVETLVDAAIANEPLDPRIRRALLLETRDKPLQLARLLGRMLDSAKTSDADRLAWVADWLQSLHDDSVRIETLASQAPAELQRELAKLPALFAEAQTFALNDRATIESRCAALRVVQYAGQVRDANPDGNSPATPSPYLTLLSSQTPSAVQIAAVPVLLRTFESHEAENIVAQWPTLLPSVRTAIINQLLSNVATTRWLLGELQNDHLSSRDVEAARREQLLQHRDPEIAKLAAEVFRDTLNADRVAVIERYRSSPDSASAERGKPLFEKHCAVCHVGTPDSAAFGPDLRSLSDRSTTALLPAILDPSRAVEPKYIAYQIETKSGELVYGLIIGESGPTLRIRQVDGKTRELTRDTIESINNSQRSFMPDGLELDLTPQDLADLMQYVRELL